MNKRIRIKRWKQKETRRRTEHYTPDFNANSYDEMTDIFEALNNSDAIDYITMVRFDGHTATAVNIFGYPEEILHDINKFAERTGEDKEDFVYFINALFSNDDRETYLIMEYGTDDTETEYNRYSMGETVYYPLYGSDDAYGFHIQLSGDKYTKPKKHDHVMTLRESVVIR